MRKATLAAGLVFALLFLTIGFALKVEAQAPLITMSVEAGFDGRFRDNQWMPVIIQVRNDGDDMQGRLVVRPQTSGQGITNTYSAPVTLPNGADQSVTLYITARNFAQQIRVELIDDEGLVVEGDTAPVRAIVPLDRLYVVVTESAAGSVDLSSANAGRYDAFQTNWRVQDVPDQADAIRAANVMLFSDVDTSDLSLGQREAIKDWVIAGGQLIVTGGPAWQATAAAFEELLPLAPQNSATVGNLNGLTEWLRVADDLNAQTVIATGTLRDDATTLAATPDGLPLLARRTLGAGVVDYLAADPNVAPLRGWNGLPNLWLTLQTTLGSQPGWSYGFTNWDFAGGAVEILPGFNLLPDVLPLCLFLGLYIGLIGPLNYFILARLNRREFAWITIPILIVLFSSLSWIVGFNLRGTEATLSRLHVVRSWPDADEARVDGLVGLLSPRRANYDLMLVEGGTLRPIPRNNTPTGALPNNIQSSVEIQQTGQFSASDFSVDASFIAGFNVGSSMVKPDISGSATIIYVGNDGQLRIRGSVRNDTDFTLENPVLLARGYRLGLGDSITPGSVETFDMEIAGEGIPAPGLFSPSINPVNYSSYYNSNYYYMSSSPTVTDLLGQEDQGFYDSTDSSVQEDRRRRLFVGSFVSDMYSSYNSNGVVRGIASGRGDHVYLAGWTSAAPQDIELVGAAWNAQDTTLYMVELETEFASQPGQVTVAADRFTWVLEEYNGLGDVAPYNMTMQTGEVADFRFTPLPGAVLDDVSQLILRLEGSSSNAPNLPVFLYNWDSGEWEELNVNQAGNNTGVRRISRPQRFLGPENAVLLRIDSDAIQGYVQFNRIVIEQRGRFE